MSQLFPDKKVFFNAKMPLNSACVATERMPISSLDTSPACQAPLTGAWQAGLARFQDWNPLICRRCNFVLGVVPIKVCLASSNMSKDGKNTTRAYTLILLVRRPNTRKLWHNQKKKVASACLFVNRHETSRESLARRHRQVVWEVSPARITASACVKQSDDVCNLQPPLYLLK